MSLRSRFLVLVLLIIALAGCAASDSEDQSATAAEAPVPAVTTVESSNDAAGEPTPGEVTAVPEASAVTPTTAPLPPSTPVPQAQPAAENVVEPVVFRDDFATSIAPIFADTVRAVITQVARARPIGS